MSSERQGRVLEVQGASAAAVLAGVMAVIDSAMQVEPATENKQERLGLCMKNDGIILAIPNQKWVVGSNGTLCSAVTCRH